MDAIVAWIGPGEATVIAGVLTLAGVVWQGRKTRKKGTSEHVMAQQERRENRRILESMQADVRDVKADVRSVKADVNDLKASSRQHDADLRQHDADLHQQSADIADIRKRQDRGPLHGLGEGK